MGAMVNLDGVTVYRAEPTVPPRGAVILIHEVWGLVDHIRDVADRFAAQGYLTLAPDLLSGAGITPEVGAELDAVRQNPDESRRLAGQARLREAMTPIREPGFAAEAVTSLRLVVDALAEEPGMDGRIAVTGFCFGGTYSFALAAADERIRVAIPFYGSAPDAEGIGRIACPVLALYGENDPRIVDDLPRVRADMAAAGADFTAHVYPGVGHAFFNDTNATAHDSVAAADAWDRALGFLNAHLRPAGHSSG